MTYSLAHRGLTWEIKKAKYQNTKNKQTKIPENTTPNSWACVSPNTMTSIDSILSAFHECLSLNRVKGEVCLANVHRIRKFILLFMKLNWKTQKDEMNTSHFILGEGGPQKEGWGHRTSHRCRTHFPFKGAGCAVQLMTWGKVSDPLKPSLVIQDTFLQTTQSSEQEHAGISQANPTSAPRLPLSPGSSGPLPARAPSTKTSCRSSVFLPGNKPNW